MRGITSSPLKFAKNLPPSAADSERTTTVMTVVNSNRRKQPLLHTDYMSSPSFENILHEIRFSFFPEVEERRKREVIKGMFALSLGPETYKVVSQAVNSNDFASLERMVKNISFDAEKLKADLEAEFKVPMTQVKDLNTILDLYYEQEDSDKAYNFLRYMIFTDFQTKETFDNWVKWYSSLTPEQKEMNIPSCIWNAVTL